MSKPNQTFSRWIAAVFVATTLTSGATAATKPTGQPNHDSERISIDHARVATPQNSDRPSLVAAAATGRLLAEVPQAPLDGTLVRGKVRKVGYLEGNGSDCGPVCDCPSCGAEPVCGIEVGCGVEPGCGIEVGCGLEPGCGIDVGCGVEPGCGYEVGCGMESTGPCGCDACCDEIDSIPFCLPLLRVSWCRFDFFAGVQGYTGPMNHVSIPNVGRASSGSFGFYEGFNEGRSLRSWFGWDMAAQFGARATQSNLSGASFTDEVRNQVFVTGGLFRRVDYGLQYGVVIDYLNDDWYFHGDLLQLRSELSWRTEGCHVYGFQYFAGINDDTSTTTIGNGLGGVTTGTVDFEATDQYRIFYRRLLASSGQWDAFGGWTDDDDGIVGTTLSLPLRRNIALSTGATFLFPTSDDATDFEQESWNISLGLIYRPGGPQGCGRYCRPMFDVADNGTFMVDRK